MERDLAGRMGSTGVSIDSPGGWKWKEILRACKISFHEILKVPQPENQRIGWNLSPWLAEGRKLATFLRTGVKQHYGNRSEKLAEFDLQPFRGRKSQATPPPEKRPGKQPDPEKAE